MKPLMLRTGVVILSVFVMALTFNTSQWTTQPPGQGTFPWLTDLLEPAAAHAQNIVSPFDGEYTFTDLGPVPGLPPSAGGLTLNLGDPNTLLIGGSANSGVGQLFEIGVTRDAEGHITGFSGTALPFADAAFNDGGVVFGPGNVLFLARWPVNQLGQTKPGSTITDKVIDLTPLGVGGGGPGGLNFVPAGFPGAGQLKLVTWPSGFWYTLNLAPDGAGTFDVTSATQQTQVVGGPEGLAYVPTGSPLFPHPSVLVSEFSTGSVATYETDGNGDPIVATRRTFMTGLSGAEGAHIDHVTGDFMFSTFGGGDRVVVVKGFMPPPPNFPAAGTDSFLSVAVFVVDVLNGPTIQTPVLLDFNTQVERSGPLSEDDPAPETTEELCSFLPAGGCVDVQFPDGFGGVGRREVVTEIVSLNLVGDGFSVKAGQPALDHLTDMGHADLFTPSLGEVESLDLTGAGPPFPADSFFDVFAVIETPLGPLFNKEPLIVVSRGIGEFPPIAFYPHESTTGAAVPLFAVDDPDGPMVASLTTAVHGTRAPELIGVPVDDLAFEELAAEALVENLPEPLPVVVVCDVDMDGDIDRDDIGDIFAARGQSSTGPNDPRDADGDGAITIGDARACVLQCTNPRCAP